jgi:hypothetical protein
MNSITGLGWTNSNSSRNYPFLDNANLSLDSVGFLPNDFIVDARIYMRNTYEAASAPYVSKLQIGIDKAVFTVACDRIELGTVELPYALASEAQPNEEKGIYLDANGVDLLAISSLKQGNILTGHFVININGLNTIQAINQGTYEFLPNTLRFAPNACEYLPGPQVTSINGLSGNLILRGESGIRVERVNETDIKVSIVGDPHFTRFNCIEGIPDELLTSFLERLTVIHYADPNSESPLQTSNLQVMRNANYGDGSIDFALSSPAEGSAEERRAFRINVQGNTITLSMAGG